MESVIKINNLTKSFKEVKAVDGISFKVKKGEFFAFLGENGAGKSTTISIICGILKKDNGECFLCGYDIDKDGEKIKDKLGVVFQNSALDKPLSVWDNLFFKGCCYNKTEEEIKDKINYLAEKLDFKNILKRPFGKLSGGQKRRIDLARALLSDPEILILDEPTTGLDPQTRKIVWDFIYTLKKEKGLTVFLTTHYMEETALSDYVVILDKGKIVAEGSPLELKNKYTGDYVNIYGVNEEEIKSLKRPYEKIAGGYKIEVEDTKEATEMIINHPEVFSDYEVIKGKMDDVFLNVTGKKLSEVSR